MPINHASSASHTPDIPSSPGPDGTGKRGLLSKATSGMAAAGAAGAGVAGAAVVSQAADPALESAYQNFESILANSLTSLAGGDGDSGGQKSRQTNSQASQMASPADGQTADPSSPDAQPAPDAVNPYKTLLDNGNGKNPFAVASAANQAHQMGFSSDVTWNSGTLSDSQLQIVSVLDRHKDQCPLSWNSLQDKINDSSTPPDLKAALQGLQNDPQLFYAIGSQGDGKCGGKIKAGDLSDFSANHSQVASYKEQQATSYENNYIPSDGSSNGQPQTMTENDAMRELYRYSDNLPKNLSIADFKQIVDGDSKTGKTPPQVVAAAKYFVDHPDQWKQLFGGNVDQVHTSDFLQVASSSMHMTQDELNTLDTINKNQNAFFGSGDLTRDKLSKMADDKSLDPKVKQAASQLLNDPLLFGVLNNSITGYKTHHGFFNMGGGHTVDSGNISNNDFNHFYSTMSSANRTVEKPVTHTPKTAADQAAVQDMMAGIDDQPEIKTPKHNGGALMHGLEDALSVYSKVMDWGATALGALSFIPGIGELADAGSAVLEGESQVANIARTVISGGNLKQALEEAGLSMAAQAVGDIAGPEAKIAMRDGLTKTLLEKAATAGLNVPLATAQYAAVGAMNNMKAKLEGAPTQGPFSFMQSLEEGGINNLGEAIDSIGGREAKFEKMSDGLVKKGLEKATTQVVNAPLSAAKSYADSYLNNLQMEVAAGSQPPASPTQTAPTNPSLAAPAA